ncbi:mycothiol synthase [Actinocorallia populi]|uniref:mycothiol synthase n=1 Tax=Actinocorallia populi TaxID=2079200 RepID=UPI000D08FCA6|nr:mycothiol synthase [Actinocorallia populi]
MAAVHELSPEESSAVLDLASRATEADGVAPLSEQTLLDVRHGGGEHHLRYDTGRLAGYAYTDGESAEVVVDPDFRRRGVGGALVSDLLAGNERVRIWAHGDLPGAAPLAAGLGLAPVRTLLQMRRPLDGRLPVQRIHAGFTLRTFEPKDAEAWLRINGLSFADHPEQGQWTMEDLRQRMAEPWFDPKGFFLACKGDRVVGFHWTKVHPDGLGEVYVVGVDPSAQGVGLGRALTLAGLHHLQSLNLKAVLLYVDAGNTSAVRLYESLGFTRYRADVMYGRP